MFKKDDLSLHDKKEKSLNNKNDQGFWMMPMYLVFGVIASLLLACSPFR